MKNKRNTRRGRAKRWACARQPGLPVAWYRLRGTRWRVEESDKCDGRWLVFRRTGVSGFYEFTSRAAAMRAAEHLARQE